MKKQLSMLLVFGLAVGMLNAGEPVTKLSNEEKLALVFKVTGALTNLAGGMAEKIPAMIKQVPEFPNKVRPLLADVRKLYGDAAKLPKGAAQDAILQEAFIKATNILVEVNNILDNILGIAKLITPIIEIIGEATKEAKVKEVAMAMNMIMDAIYVITKVAVKQQEIVKNENPELKDKVKQDPAPIALPDF